MIAVDTNILVYAHRQDTEWHARAIAALTPLAQGDQTWAIPWPCVHEFLAIVTHPRIFRPPTPSPLAVQAIRVWLESPSCRVLGEGPGYFETLARVLTDAQARGGQIHDARIAALCEHHRVGELWTLDRDFSRFTDLCVVNPLT